MNTKKDIIQYAQQIKSRLHVVSDVRKTKNVEYFMGVVISYIHNNKMMNFLLDARRIYNDCGNTLFNNFINILEEYNINWRITAVVSDNSMSFTILGCVNLAYTSLFETYSIDRKEIFQKQLFWVRCKDHCIHWAMLEN